MPADAEPLPGIKPGFLLESLRSFGYAAETAVADLVDNCITAGATRIEIQFTWKGSATGSTVRVSDNGSGMSRQQLAEAMTVPSSDTREKRDPGDLGRFGLGMKTASWSIGRRMTVTSRKRRQTSVLCWDLDRVAETGRASPFDPTDQDPGLPVEPLKLPGDAASGTRVEITQCDRLLGESGGTAATNKRAFEEIVVNTRRHLEAVFHTFLNPPRPVRISVNDFACIAWDPFLKGNEKTQTLSTESLLCAGEQITVKPYVLPHGAFRSEDDERNFEGSLGQMSHQGFFIYRAGRLIVPGGWFGRGAPGPRGNTVLARIEVNLSQSMDDAWNLNVLKSRARPPANLRNEFGRIGDAVRQRSIQVYNYRGIKAVGGGTGTTAPTTPMWRQDENELAGPGHARYRFRINTDHRIVEAALSDLDSGSKKRVRSMIKTIEATLPVAAITAADMAEANSVGPQYFDNADLSEAAEVLYQSLRNADMDHDEAIGTLRRQNPFGDLPSIVEELNGRHGPQ
jgi:hypothetical protein